MKNRIVLFVAGVALLAFFLFMFHNPVVESRYDFLPPLNIEDADGCDLIESKEMAYKIARQVFIEKYGYSSLLFMTFDCRLQDNKYWILEGRNKLHVLFKSCGGGPYIVIEKSGRILAVGHTG